MSSQSTLTTEQKIDYIFNYIQTHQDSANNRFWTELSPAELEVLNQVSKEETVSLNDLV